MDCLGDYLDAGTWSYASQTERLITQTWLRDRAGWRTAKAGCDAQSLVHFSARLWQRLVLEISAVCMGPFPQVNALATCNPHWTPAVLPYLSLVAPDEVALRTRVQALEIADTLGISLPICTDGTHFDVADGLFQFLEGPHASAANLGRLVGCSGEAIRHVLRYRGEWAPPLSLLSKAMRQAVIRGLDAISNRSAWPRERQTLDLHVQTMKRGAVLAEYFGDAQAWLKWAHGRGSAPEAVNRHAEAVAGLVSKVRDHLQDSRVQLELGQDAGRVVDRTMRSLVSLVRACKASELSEIGNQIFRRAHIEFLAQIGLRCAAAYRGDAWAPIERALSPLPANWSATSTATGLRLRLLTRRSQLMEWGRIADNCLDHAGAVMAYIAHKRLLFAVESATSPHTPIATVAMGDLLSGQEKLPGESCRGIVELQLVSNLRSLSEKQKELELQSVRRACDDLERGTALWQATGVEIRQWHQNVTGLESHYETESASMRIGSFLPDAVDQVASLPQFSAADWQLEVAA